MPIAVPSLLTSGHYPPEMAASTQTDHDSRSRRHTVAATVCGVFAVVLVLLGSCGFWFMRTAADDDWTRQQVAIVLRQPEVRDSLSQKLVDEFDQAVDIDDRIAALLPDRLDGAAELLAQTARTQMETRVSRALGSDVVIDVTAAAVGQAQAGAIAVLEGDGAVEGVNLETGEVRINLLPLIPRVIATGQGLGLFSDVEIPDLDGLDRSQQLSALSEALDRPLDDDFAYPVAFESEALVEAGDTLDTVRLVVLWTRRLFWLLLLLGVAFGAAAIYLAPRRERAALWLGAGLAVALVGLRLVLGTALGQLPNITANLGAQIAIAQVADSALAQLTRWFVLLALVVAAALGVIWYWLDRDRLELDWSRSADQNRNEQSS